MAAPPAALVRIVASVPAAMAGPITGMTPARTPRPTSPADAGSGDSARDGSVACMCFGLSSVLDDGLFLRIAGHDSDLVVAEPGLDEIINCPISFASLVKNANDSGTR